MIGAAMNAIRSVSLVVLLVAVSCTATEPASDWRVLFDGTSLDGFEVTEFGGEGPVAVEDGRLVLDFGSPMTGVTWVGDPLPTVDYEVELQAARLSGTDFFCGLTFPVRDSWATLVLGGWGGALCGISSLDGFDASENETMSLLYLETGKVYRVRLRVTATRIRAWLDDEPLVDVSIEDREVGIRPEVDLSRPFGVASFATRAAIGPIRLRRL